MLNDLPQDLCRITLPGFPQLRAIVAVEGNADARLARCARGTNVALRGARAEGGRDAGDVQPLGAASVALQLVALIGATARTTESARS